MIEACFHDGVNIRLGDRDYDGGMATSIDQKNFVKTALRLPPELHAAVHESAQKNGRSYNAELVSALQEVVELRAHAAALESAVHEQAAGRERDAKLFSSSIDALTRMNGLLGYYLNTVADMVPKQSPEGKEMMRLIGAMGGAVHSRDYQGAVEAAAELVRLGERHGLLELGDKTTHAPDKVAQKLKAKPHLLR
ncbi:MAG: hypothetical protein RJB68_2494 [Pseudomonadota bacterium]|jgi:hypothetical protein